MSDNDLEIKFGADTSGLVSGAATARSEVDRIVQSIALLQKTVGAAAKATTSELTAAIQGMGSQASAAAPRIRQMTQEVAALSTAGHAGHGTIFGMQSGVFLELRALLDEALSGRMRNFEGSFARLLGLMAPTIQSFVAANPLLTAFGAAAAVTAAALGVVGYEAYQAGNAIRSIELDSAMAGFRQTDEQAQALRDSIMSLAHVSYSSAKEIADPFLALGPVGVTVAQLASVHMPALAEAMGKKLPEAAQEVAKWFVDLDSAGKRQIENSRTLTQAQKDAGLAYIASGDKVHAYAILLAGLAPVIEANKEKQDEHKASVIDSADALERAKMSGGDFSAAEANLGVALAEATAKVRVQDQAVAGLTSTLLRASDAASTFAAGMTAAMKVDKVASELKSAEGELAKINAAMSGMPDRPTAGMNELARAAKIASDKVAELHQKMTAPGGTDKDLYQQDEEALRHYENTSRTTRAGMLQGEIAMMHQQLAEQQLTDGERLRLTDKLEAAQHQLWETTSKEGAKASRDATRATVEDIGTQIAEIQRATADEIKLIELRVKAHIVGAKEGEAATTAALNAEKSSIDALYTKELAIAGQTAAQIAALRRKQELEDLTIDDQITLNAQKSANEQIKAYESAGNTIMGTWNGQMRGLLEGTTTWAQASKKILADLTIKAIEEGEKLLVQTLAQQAAGLAAKKSMDVATVGGDAGRAAAGAYAATATIPIIGPVLAPAAAAAAYAGTMAFAAFDIGAYQIPSDMPAIVHRNELVMPAAEAGAFRNMLSGAASGDGFPGSNGGGDTHVHLHMPSAIDSGSVKQWFHNNSAHVASALHRAVQRGEAHGLRGLGAR